MRTHAGDTGDLVEFAPGAGLVNGHSAWLIFSDDPGDGAGLGAALIWAVRRDVSELNIVAAGGASVMARRAAEFTLATQVFDVGSDGVTMRAVAPCPPEPPPAPLASHVGLIGDIVAAGAEPVIEWGVVTGEVRGLEVCRVVENAEGRVRLEVGVGTHDREAFAMIHGDVPTVDALSSVVQAVLAVRELGGPPHRLRRLAPERLLRWRLAHEPWLVGMASVAPAQPPVARRNLSERVPCAARGERVDGSRAVVVCSVGVDLDVIPYALDARLALGEAGFDPSGGVGSPDLVVVTPVRDLLAVTRDLAGVSRHSVVLSSVD